MENEVVVALTFSPDDRAIEIELLQSDSNNDENVRPTQNMQVLRVGVEDLLEKGSEHAALVVGNAALSLFQAIVTGGIGYDESIQNSLLSKVNSFMLNRANQGDADAKHHVAIARLLESVEKLDESLLQDAGRLLSEAASSGSQMSKKFLDESWEKVSQHYLHEIQRRRDSG